MGLMTLPEYAKGLEKTNVARPIVEMFAASSDIMAALPFEGFSGAAYEYYREAALPTGMAFRAINEGAQSGNGKITPLQEPSFPIDFNLDIDKAILLRHGMERRSREERMQVAKMGRVWANTFLNGDNTTQPREFNGIKKRCTLHSTDRVLANSASSGGAALSLNKLDNAINMVAGATHILTARKSLPLWIGAARNTSLSGFVIQTWDQVGTPKMTYAGLPILFGYPREIEGELMDFDEVGSGGGGAVTASLYVMKLGEGGIRGIQLKSMEVTDKGLLEDNITWRTSISWDVGLVDEHPYCISRLTSWTNAAIVA